MRFPKRLTTAGLLFAPMFLALGWFAPWPAWTEITSHAEVFAAQASSSNVKIAKREQTENRYLGSASCAAARCHGAGFDAQLPKWNSSYSVWRADDPHARALDDLLSVKGQEMGKRYFADDGRTRPERDKRCLSCHATASGVLQEGVGCESCHGPSSHWQAEHYLHGWKTNRVASGFLDLRNPSVRAQVCAACHVGDGADRDVNHDLIAAGHPPLRFEMGAFHEHMPKHWDAEREQRADPQWEARLWLAGQIESSRAALQLLNDRITDTRKPWPELAEYDCESCHHPLASPSWRQSLLSLDRPGAPLGKPLWGTWQFSPRLVDAALANQPDATELQQQLAELRQVLSNLAAAPQGAIDRVRALRSQWPASDVASHPLPALHAQESLQRLSLPQAAADRTWSAAAQRWLARMAFGPQAAAGKKKLQAMQTLLESPVNFDPEAMQTLER